MSRLRLCSFWVGVNFRFAIELEARRLDFLKHVSLRLSLVSA